MSTSKRDYEEVARIIRMARRESPPSTCEYVIAAIEKDLALHFARSNPKFDIERFKAACLPKEKT